MGLIGLETVDLLRLCVINQQNCEAWTELLLRVLPKIKCFVRGTLRRRISPGLKLHASVRVGGADESDLSQEILLKLVENNCALLKRFAGKTEAEFLAYIAGISRRVVRDCVRRQAALKRATESVPQDRLVDCLSVPGQSFPIETRILAREYAERIELGLQDHNRNRNRLIFQLYFFAGLSALQIANCAGIGLSHAGVKKVLGQMIEKARVLPKKGKSESPELPSTFRAR